MYRTIIKKRWMQLDANPQYLSIAIDHNFGEIKKHDLVNLDLQYGLNSSSNANAIHLRKNNDAVILPIFIHEHYDFTKEEFLHFLHKHYQSYLRKITKYDFSLTNRKGRSSVTNRISAFTIAVIVIYFLAS